MIIDYYTNTTYRSIKLDKMMYLLIVIFKVFKIIINIWGDKYQKIKFLSWKKLTK